MISQPVLSSKWQAIESCGDDLWWHAFKGTQENHHNFVYTTKTFFTYFIIYYYFSLLFIEEQPQPEPGNTYSYSALNFTFYTIYTKWTSTLRETEKNGDLARTTHSESGRGNKHVIYLLVLCSTFYALQTTFPMVLCYLAPGQVSLPIEVTGDDQIVGRQSSAFPPFLLSPSLSLAVSLQWPCPLPPQSLGWTLVLLSQSQPSGDGSSWDVVPSMSS